MSKNKNKQKSEPKTNVGRGDKDHKLKRHPTMNELLGWFLFLKLDETPSATAQDLIGWINLVTYGSPSQVHRLLEHEYFEFTEQFYHPGEIGD